MVQISSENVLNLIFLSWNLFVICFLSFVIYAKKVLPSGENFSSKFSVFSKPGTARAEHGNSLSIFHLSAEAALHPGG